MASFCVKFCDIFCAISGTSQKCAFEHHLGATGCRKCRRIKFFGPFSVPAWGADCLHSDARICCFAQDAAQEVAWPLWAPFWFNFGSLCARSWEHFGRLWAQFCPPFGAHLPSFQPVFNSFKTNPVVRILASSDDLLGSYYFPFR